MITSKEDEILDKKTVSVIIVSTILGSLIGYNLSYSVLNSKIEDLENQFSNAFSEMNSSLSTLSSEIDSITLTLDSVQTELNNTKSNASNMNARVSDMASNIENLNSLINNVRAEISQAEEEIGQLGSSISGIESKTWHLAYIFSRSNESKKGDVFTIKGDAIRISWIFGGQVSSAEIRIGLYFQNGTLYMWIGLSGFWSALANDISIKEVGEYYLFVDVYLANYWVVSVWDYY